MQIISGGLDAWDALAYGEQNPANVNYFKTQLQNIGNTLTDFGKQFYNDAARIYDSFNGSQAMQVIRNVTKAAKTLFQPNIVKSLFEMDDIQMATMVMQRWIMANPVVRQMYHEQKCEGYSDSYVDAQPGVVGENHYDYRRVMDGVIQEDGDTWFAKFYPDDLLDGDKELIFEEKVDILNTWSIVEMFMAAGEKDPTSQYNSSL